MFWKNEIKMDTAISVNLFRKLMKHVSKNNWYIFNMKSKIWKKSEAFTNKNQCYLTQLNLTQLNK